jgi:energy-coupling factor transporter ATP-binding protein EcfA2
MSQIGIASPYPGLRPFAEEESEIFYGREEQVDSLLKKMEHSRFLMITGASGCGKSSLSAAGLIPALKLGFLESAGEVWKIAKMRPGDRPIWNLAQALIRDAEIWGEHKSDNDIALLNAELKRGPLGLVEILKQNPLPEKANLLVLADQFEEIFRYRKENADAAEAFTDLLLETAKHRELPVYVLLTMRSDFLGDCSLFSGLPEAMNDNQFLTPRMTRDQRRAAIVGPAELFEGSVQPELVNRLLNDSGADPDQLPVLQHCLMRMWTKMPPNLLLEEKGGVFLTLEAYESVGTLEHALSDHADEVFNSLSDPQKAIAEVLFRCLSERSADKRDTRRPVKLGEAAQVAGVSPE